MRQTKGLGFWLGVFATLFVFGVAGSLGQERCDPESPKSWVKAFSYKAREGYALPFGPDAFKYPAWIEAEHAAWLETITQNILAKRPAGTYVTELYVYRNICNDQPRVEFKEFVPTELGTVGGQVGQPQEMNVPRASKKRAILRTILLGVPIALGVLVNPWAGYLSSPLVSLTDIGIGSGKKMVEETQPKTSSSIVAAEPVFVREIGHSGTKR